MFWTTCESAVSGKQYPKDKYTYMATDEGEYAVLSTRYDMEGIKASLPGSLLHPSQGLFRYMPFLPIDPKSQRPSFAVGGTPLVHVPKSSFKFNLWIKDEGRNPTGSLKDRSSALVCTKAKELGIKTITTASSGNAAAATSAMACNLGLECAIFVPKDAPAAKVAQNRIFGSKVYLVDGVYDDAVAICKQVAERKGWYNRSTGFNYLTVDGKKTVSFEICEQFASFKSGKDWAGEFEAPDVIVCPCGVGNILSGIHKGLCELKEAGLISKVPRLIAVQAEGSNSLYVCWKEGGDPTKIEPMVPFTKADSLSTAWPNDSIRAIRAVTETGGAFIEVNDDQIFTALPEMARTSGVFGEPASATAWAGLKLASDRGLIKEGENVVLVSTGNGLKDTNGAIRSVEGQDDIVMVTDPDLL